MILQSFKSSDDLRAINEELLVFYSNFRSQGWVELKKDRLLDFFGIYRVQSDKFETFVLRDKATKQIQVCASFLIQDVKTHEGLQRIAFATDLRVAPSRKTILEWSQHFLPALEKIKREWKVQYFFSVIDLTEPSPFNTFLRPGSRRQNLPRYHLYRKFNVTTLHGQFPWAPKPIQSIKIKEGNAYYLDALLSYLIKRQRYKYFSSLWDQDSFDAKIHRWPGFKLSDFLIAFDKQEQIIGCLALWSSDVIYKLIPYSFQLHANNFRQFLKFGQLLGWTKPIAKPFSSTEKETPFQFHWLPHIAVDNEDIFESLLWVAFEKLKKYREQSTFLAYTQVNHDFRILPPRAWISAQLPFAVYSLLNPSEERPNFLHPREILNPEIEHTLIF